MGTAKVLGRGEVFPSPASSAASADHHPKMHAAQLLVACAGLHLRPLASLRGTHHRPRIAVSSIVQAPAMVLSAGAPIPRELNQKIMQASSAAEILQLHAENGDGFSNINLSTCWSRLGRARGRERTEMLHRDGGGRQLGALRHQTIATLDGWKARNLANLAHALGKLKVSGGAWNGLWEAVAQASVLRRRVRTAGARQHGMGIRNRRPRGAGAVRRDRKGGGAAGG